MRFLFALTLLVAVAIPAAAQSVASASRIEGVVTDAETGQPVVGAGLMIPALEIGAVSGRDGRFVLDGVPPGPHTVRVGAFTYHMTTFEVDVPPGEPAALDAKLRLGAGCAAIHEHDEDGGHDDGADG